MTLETRGDTRSQIIDAAAHIVTASPGGDFSLRAICEAVGVKMPTLYHHFGSKQGLTEAVAARGFELYLDKKAEQKTTGDPIRDLRQGWDTHVEFGITHPGLYALMYGTVRPGYIPPPQLRASEMLLQLTTLAARKGHLAVPAEQAADHVLAANIGVTLRLIALSRTDWELSNAVREGTIAAITGATEPTESSYRADALRLIRHATMNSDVLGVEETRLLQTWLLKLTRTGAL